MDTWVPIVLGSFIVGVMFSCCITLYRIHRVAELTEEKYFRLRTVYYQKSDDVEAAQFV